MSEDNSTPQGDPKKHEEVEESTGALAGKQGNGGSSTSISQDRAPSGESPHPWDEYLYTYPLRAKDEDPRWAVRTVWGWTGVALFFLVFITTFFILGFFYD